MAGKALDDEAGRALANQVRALFAADLDIQGVQIVLYNGQAKPAPLKTITLPAASETAPGVMSAADKAKLDGVAAGANKTVVDSALSSASANPVQNKAVKAALDGKAPTASPSFTGAPKAPTPDSGSSDTRIATTAFVQAAIAAKTVGAVVYKGAASKESDISATAYKAGWYWVVKAAGTFMGEACEAGDMVFANSDKGSAFSASHFDVVQANISYVTADDVKSWFA